MERMGKKTGACMYLVGRYEGKCPLVRSRSRCQNNIKTDLQGVGWDMDLNDLAQYRDRETAFVKAAMDVLVP
jgi:hypothetical protein